MNDAAKQAIHYKAHRTRAVVATSPPVYNINVDLGSSSPNQQSSHSGPQPAGEPPQPSRLASRNRTRFPTRVQDSPRPTPQALRSGGGLRGFPQHRHTHPLSDHHNPQRPLPLAPPPALTPVCTALCAGWGPRGAGWGGAGELGSCEVGD